MKWLLIAVELVQKKYPIDCDHQLHVIHIIIDNMDQSFVFVHYLLEDW